MKRSFFEYLGYASVEKMHSQMLAWILSSDCTAIASSDKLKFLSSITKIPITGSIEKVLTESFNTDILIITSRHIIIIENKIKTSQSPHQLEKYTESISREFPDKGEPIGLYLTLVCDLPNCKKWKHVSYQIIQPLLASFSILDDNIADAVIFKEYLALLHKLVSATALFEKTPHAFPEIFQGGKIKKQHKNVENYPSLESGFLCINQLETILQVAFFRKVENALRLKSPGINTYVTETQGDALINIYLNQDISIEGNSYETFLQFQNGRFKYAINQRGGGGDVVSIQFFIPLLMELAALYPQKFKLRVNTPKTRAYASLSLKDEFANYWENGVDGFVHEALTRKKVLEIVEFNLRSLLNPPIGSI